MGKALNKIALVPPNNTHFSNRVFKQEYHRDNGEIFFKYLKKFFLSEGYQLNTIDKYEGLENVTAILIYRLDYHLKYLLRALKKNKKIKIYYFALEPPSICHLHNNNILKLWQFNQIYSWNDKLSIINGFQKIYYTSDIQPLFLNEEIFRKRRDKIVAIFSYKRGKKANGYKLRYNIIHQLSKQNLIDLYGYGWEKCNDKYIRKCYNGVISSKKEILVNYKYCLSFENSSFDNYFTEKIFDPISMGCIPLYWGAPNIGEYIDSNLIIKVGMNDNPNLLLKKVKDFDMKLFLKSREKFVKNYSGSPFNPIVLSKHVVSRILNDKNKNITSRNYTFIFFKSIINSSVFKSRRYFFDLFFHLFK